MQPLLSPNPWLQLSLSVFRLGVEAQALVCLRLFGLPPEASGRSPRPAWMVPEKVAALLEASRIVALGPARAIMRQGVRMYRKRVAGNQIAPPDVPHAIYAHGGRK